MARKRSVRTTGVFVVWVLVKYDGDDGFEYLVRDPHEDLHDEQVQWVVARLGPFAFEEGTGLEQFKEQHAEQLERFHKHELERKAAARIERLVQAAVSKRLPPDPDVQIDVEVVPDDEG